MPQTSTDNQHLAWIADRLIKTLALPAAQIDPHQLETDIRLLAQSRTGQRHLALALSAQDDDLALAIGMLVHRVAADLICKADLVWRRTWLWSTFGMAGSWAVAALALDMIDQMPNGHLGAFFSVALPTAGFALTAVGIGTLRRRSLLAESAAVRALVAACKSGDRHHDAPPNVASMDEIP